MEEEKKTELEQLRWSECGIVDYTTIVDSKGVFSDLDKQQEAMIQLIEENRELKHTVIEGKTVEEWIKEKDKKSDLFN